MATVAASAGCGGRAVTHPSSASPGAGSWSAAAAVPVAFAEEAPFVVPGERMTYRLSIFDIEIAAFSIAVGEVAPLAGHSAVVVQAGAQSSGIMSAIKKVAADFTTWIDVKTGKPLLFRASESAGADDDAIEKSEAQFADASNGKFQVVTQNENEAELDEWQTVVTAPFDLPTFLMALRGITATPGEHLTADVMRSRFMWRTQLTVVGSESVVTELGELPVIRFDGVNRRVRRDGTVDPNSDERHYSIWISDDEDRVPVLVVAKTDYGDIKMEIIDYTAGGSANLRTVLRH